MIAAVGAFRSHDRSYAGRSAALSLVLLADMDRYALKIILLLFQLRFFTTADPPLKRTVRASYTSPPSFTCPASDRHLFLLQCFPILQPPLTL
jgi:hypothetical protein